MSHECHSIPSIQNISFHTTQILRVCCLLSMFSCFDADLSPMKLQEELQEETSFSRVCCCKSSSSSLESCASPPTLNWMIVVSLLLHVILPSTTSRTTTTIPNKNNPIIIMLLVATIASLRGGCSAATAATASTTTSTTRRFLSQTLLLQQRSSLSWQRVLFVHSNSNYNLQQQMRRRHAHNQPLQGSSSTSYIQKRTFGTKLFLEKDEYGRLIRTKSSNQKNNKNDNRYKNQQKNNNNNVRGADGVDWQQLRDDDQPRRTGRNPRSPSKFRAKFPNNNRRNTNYYNQNNNNNEDEFDDNNNSNEDPDIPMPQYDEYYNDIIDDAWGDDDGDDNDEQQQSPRRPSPSSPKRESFRSSSLRRPKGFVDKNKNNNNRSRWDDDNRRSSRRQGDDDDDRKYDRDKFPLDDSRRRRGMDFRRGGTSSLNSNYKQRRTNRHDDKYNDFAATDADPVGKTNMKELENAGFVHLYGLSSCLNALQANRRSLLDVDAEEKDRIQELLQQDSDNEDIDDDEYWNESNENVSSLKPEAQLRSWLFVLKSSPPLPPYQRSAEKTIMADEIVKLAHERNVPVAYVDRGVLNTLSGNRPHQGYVLRCGKLSFEPLSRIPFPSNPIDPSSSSPSLWLVLDEVVDPQNLGALIRSAYFLGGGDMLSSVGILVCAKNSAPPSAVVSAASAGALEVATVYNTANLPRTLQLAQQDGYRIIGASSSPPPTKRSSTRDDNVDKDDKVGDDNNEKPTPVVYDLQDLPTSSNPTLLVLGSEGHGLRTLVARACTEFVKIPSGNQLDNSSSGVDSLNVSVTGGILLWHLLSQLR